MICGILMANVSLIAPIIMIALVDMIVTVVENVNIAIVIVVKTGL